MGQACQAGLGHCVLRLGWRWGMGLRPGLGLGGPSPEAETYAGLKPPEERFGDCGWDGGEELRL